MSTLFIHPNSCVAMCVPDAFWQLVQLRGNGGVQPVELGTVQSYLQTEFPELWMAGKSSAYQCQVLFRHHQKGDEQATWSLRCFISHEIIKVCKSLVVKHGARYNLDLLEIVRLVLQDVAPRTQSSSSRPAPSPAWMPLALKILDSFNPDAGSALATWTNTITYSNDDLKNYLAEKGMVRRSPWGLLNAYKTAALPKILWDFTCAESYITQAIAIHTAYCAIFQNATLQPSETPAKRQPFAEPTPEQFQAMVQHYNHHHQLTIEIETFQTRLQELIHILRQHRGKIRDTESIEGNSNHDEDFQPRPIIDPKPTPIENAIEIEFRELLETLATKLSDSLEEATGTQISARITQLQAGRSQKNTPANYITGLQLVYCQGNTQGQVMQHFQDRHVPGKWGTPDVNKLLQLSSLRDGIKRHMFCDLRPYIKVLHETDMGAPPATLFAVDYALDHYLHQLIQADQDHQTTPAANRPLGHQTRLGLAICLDIDQR